MEDGEGRLYSRRWWEGGTVIKRGDVGVCRARDAVSEKFSTRAFDVSST